MKVKSGIVKVVSFVKSGEFIIWRFPSWTAILSAMEDGIDGFVRRSTGLPHFQLHDDYPSLTIGFLSEDLKAVFQLPVKALKGRRGVVSPEARSKWLSAFVRRSVKRCERNTK